MAAGLSNLGMDLRSGYEMENQASLYQLTSRVTLGISEQETLYNLKSMAQQVLLQERSARQAVGSSLKFQDTVARSLAILRQAKLLSCKECMELLSNVRLGVACGLVQSVGYEKYCRLCCRYSLLPWRCLRGRRRTESRRKLCVRHLSIVCWRSVWRKRDGGATMVKGAQADFELAAALFYVLGAQVPHQKELESKARDMVQSLGRRKALEKITELCRGRDDPAALYLLAKAGAWLGRGYREKTIQAAQAYLKGPKWRSCRGLR
ncbi:MAG: hypothetical protein ACLSB9_36455 [Hydrogeniiclostridium mannosilyticum]